MTEYIGYTLYPPIIHAPHTLSTLPIVPMVATGTEPAPPLPFVPLGNINQQLAAIRTITAMDTQHMNDSKKDDVPEMHISADIDLSDPCNWYTKNDDRKYQLCHNASPTSVALSGDALEHLQQLATSQGITLEEALRKAIATESYLYKEIHGGAKVLLLTGDKEVREVLFPPNLFADDTGPEASIFSLYVDLLYAVTTTLCIVIALWVGSYAPYILLPLVGYQWVKGTMDEGWVPDRVVLSLALLVAYGLGRMW